MVLLSLWVACANVLILPFDVTNTRTEGNIDMNVLWTISTYVTAFFLFALIPFAYFFYENDNDPRESTRGWCGLIPGWKSQCCEGIKWALGFLICFTLVLVLMYLVLNEADIPVRYHTYNFNSSNRVSIGSEIPATYYCGSSNQVCCIVCKNIISLVSVACVENKK